MECHYRANLSARGLGIWKEMFPNSDITEEGLCDQRQFITRNRFFLDTELEEKLREIAALYIPEN